MKKISVKILLGFFTAFLTGCFSADLSIPLLAPPPATTATPLPSEPTLVVDSLEPIEAITVGSSTITLRGKGFASGMSINFLNSNANIPCSNIIIFSPTRLSCSLQAVSSPNVMWGLFDLKVTTRGQQTVQKKNAFTFNAPPPHISCVIVSSSPIPSNATCPGSSALEGPAAGGTYIKIVGTQFLKGSYATLAGVTCGNVVSTTGDPGDITCTSERSTVSLAEIRVTNPDGQYHSFGTPFNYLDNTTPLPLVRYSTNPAWYLVGHSITQNAPLIATTGATYSISPSLPVGLTLDANTGAINGIPILEKTSQLYIVTIVAPSGTITTSLNIGAHQFGSGIEGSITMTGITIVNQYAYITHNVAANDTTFTVNDGSQFNGGNEILISQAQNPGGTAHWEFITVASTVGNTINTVTPIRFPYVSGPANTTTQIVRVPQYSDVIIPEGIAVKPPDWNGRTGGLLTFRASGTLTVAGTVSAQGVGYRGGAPTPRPGVCTSQTATQGESILGPSFGPSTANNTGGGGGGQVAATDCSAGASGGGGSFGLAGLAGGTFGNATGGTAGIPYGDTQLLTFLFGSAGGGGAHPSPSCTSTDGGKGGGSIFILARTIDVQRTGLISAAGAAPLPDNSSSLCVGNNGGAGSGGSIYLKSAIMNLGTGQVSAKGGLGTNNAGNGGDGRVRLDFNLSTGDTQPIAGYSEPL